MTALLLLALVQTPNITLDTAKAAAEYSGKNGGFSFLLMQNGKVVYEEYPNGGSATRPTELASGTKSFSGVAALCAQEEGLLTLDEPASKTLTEWQNDERKSITIRQILSLCSGITGGTGALAANRVPTYADAIQYKPNAKPGEKFQYGAVPYMTWGEILRRKVEPKGLSVEQYMEQKIFKPLGMTHGLWRKGKDGNVHLPSGLAMTAREWIKFGEMVRLDGKGVLPKGRVSELFKPSHANPAYGLTWWLPTQGAAGATVRRPKAEGPRDVYLAAGAGGQRLFVIRSQGITVVRQAPVRLRQDTFKDAEFLKILLQTK